MGKSRDDLEKDLREALESIDRQLPEHKIKTLMILFEKHLNLNQGTILLNKYDYDLIKSNATRELIDKAFPKYLGDNKREVSPQEANVLCIIEATIGYLHSKDCFNKTPKFDYRKRNK